MTSTTYKRLLLCLTAVLLASCGEPAPPPPVTPPAPTTFPATEISGTLSNPTGGSAFITLTGGYEVGSEPGADTDTVNLAAPLYQGAVAAEGTFRVALTPPDDALLSPLGCTAADPRVARLDVAVASSIPTPTQSSEVGGFYSYGDPSPTGRRGLWLYVREAYRAKTECTNAAQTGLRMVDLTLAPGWNQVVADLSSGAVTLTSGEIPSTFVWSIYL